MDTYLERVVGKLPTMLPHFLVNAADQQKFREIIIEMKGARKMATWVSLFLLCFLYFLSLSVVFWENMEMADSQRNQPRKNCILHLCLIRERHEGGEKRDRKVEIFFLMKTER